MYFLSTASFYIYVKSCFSSVRLISRRCFACIYCSRWTSFLIESWGMGVGVLISALVSIGLIMGGLAGMLKLISSEFNYNKNITNGIKNPPTYVEGLFFVI